MQMCIHGPCFGGTLLYAERLFVLLCCVVSYCTVPLWHNVLSCIVLSFLFIHIALLSCILLLYSYYWYYCTHITHIIVNMLVFNKNKHKKKKKKKDWNKLYASSSRAFWCQKEEDKLNFVTVYTFSDKSLQFSEEKKKEKKSELLQSSAQVFIEICTSCVLSHSWVYALIHTVCLQWICVLSVNVGFHVSMYVYKIIKYIIIIALWGYYTGQQMYLMASIIGGLRLMPNTPSLRFL